ncbi:MAG: DNA phosphorothioation-dependent restriction protein DptG [Phenylobacterium sp.]|jgi:DNA phosphorothioation-dependent restriction protein DptG
MSMITEVNWAALEKIKIGDNQPSVYLPVKTNYNECDWGIVAGYFIGSATGKELNKYAIEDFEADCKQVFIDKGVSEEFYTVIKKAFFEKSDFFRVCPTSFLLHTQAVPQQYEDDEKNQKIKTASKKVADMLASLLGSCQIKLSENNSTHFVSKLINDVLQSKLSDSKAKSVAPASYLPFLATSFQHDVEFLSSKPIYMQDQLPALLACYTFLYTAQISLNLKAWKSGEPKSKPLFFILETEKVSSERTNVMQSGWKFLERTLEPLFPLLSMLERLCPNDNKQPLWALVEALEQATEGEAHIIAIDSFRKKFAEDRRLTKQYPAVDSVVTSMENLLAVAYDQFDQKIAAKESTRYQANDKVVQAIRQHTCKGFLKAKGRIGLVLILTQDRLLLLTNVVIGHDKKIRFYELLARFIQRGVYFDSQSEERLIEFYERIGNIERMSDSGDDVYVRTTV